MLLRNRGPMVVRADNSGASESDGYEQAVAELYATIEDSKKAPTLNLFPQLIELAKQVFEPDIVKISFTIERRAESATTIENTGEIWFARGRLFLFDRPTGDSDKCLPSYRTIGDELLEWRSGEARGKSLKRFPGDTVEFMWYLVDPSIIKRNVYSRYLLQPRIFERKNSEAGTLLLFTKPTTVFLGIEVLEDPLWFRSVWLLHTDYPEETLVMTMERPQPQSELPEEFALPPDGVVFEDVEETVESRMPYL
jgi:hypothetical protein